VASGPIYILLMHQYIAVNQYLNYLLKLCSLIHFQDILSKQLNVMKVRKVLRKLSNTLRMEACGVEYSCTFQSISSYYKE